MAASIQPKNPLSVESGVRSACSAQPASSRPAPAPAKCSSAMRRTGSSAVRARSPLRRTPSALTSRAVGRSGTLELGADVWKFLNKSARDAASQLQPDEKLLYQPSFREPMLAKIPFPPFALSEGDAETPAAGPAASRHSAADLDAF